MVKRKTFQSFIENEWPHLVAEVKMNTRLLFTLIAAVVGGAIAIIVAA